MAQSSRRARWLLGATIVLILYACFYPFEFDIPSAVAAMRAGTRELLPWGFTSRGDRLGNFLSYLPLGFLAALVAPGRWPRLLSAVVVVLAALSLSVAVESLQHATRTRVPNLVDVVMNTAGAFVGALAGLAYRARPVAVRIIAIRQPRPEPIALLLIALWIATHAAPFMPRLSGWKAWRALAPLRELDWSIAGIAIFFAGYLVLASAVRRLVTRESFWPLLVALTLASLAMRLVFAGQQLTLDECAALALALPIIGWLRQTPRARAFRFTAITVAGVAIMAMLPSIPLAHADLLAQIASAYLTIGILWLTANAGWSLLIATLASAVIIAVLESPAAAPLAIVAGLLVHAGRLLHEPMRDAARAPE